MLEEAAAHLRGGTELLSGYRSWGRVCDLADHRMLVFSLNYPIRNSSFNSQGPDKGGEGGPGGAGGGQREGGRGWCSPGTRPPSVDRS